MKDKIKGIQFIRFMAFLKIFYLHNGLYNEKLWNPGMGAAQAVSFFLVLGGAILGYRYIDEELHFSIINEVKFTWNRVKKLYYLHLVTLLYCALVVVYPVVIVYRDLWSIKMSLPVFLSNAFLIHSWFGPGYYYSFNGVSWYLCVMLLMWAISLPVLIFLKKLTSRKLWPVFFFIIAVVLYAALRIYCYNVDTRGLDLEWYGYTFPPARLVEYLFGMMIGIIVKKSRHRLKSKLFMVIFTVVELLAIVYWTYAPYQVAKTGTEGKILLWLTCNMIIVTVFLYDKGLLSRIFSWKPLEVLGDISGEAFLIHQIIINIYAQIAMNIRGVSRFGNIYCTITVLFFVLVISYVVHFSKRNHRCNILFR